MFKDRKRKPKKGNSNIYISYTVNPLYNDITAKLVITSIRSVQKSANRVLFH